VSSHVVDICGSSLGLTALESFDQLISAQLLRILHNVVDLPVEIASQNPLANSLKFPSRISDRTTLELSLSSRQDLVRVSGS